MSGKFSHKTGTFAQKPGASGAQKAKIELASAHLPTIDLSFSEIPSKGLTYPKDGKISYRPYTFGEVKRISQSKVGIKEKYKEALGGITVSFGAENLTMSDALYISHLRKLSSIGTAKVVVPFLCACCFQTNRPTVDTGELEFDDLEIKSSPVFVDLSVGEVSFSPLTVKDYFHLVDIGKEEDEIALAAIQCRDMEFDKAYEMIDQLMPQDAAVLSEVDDLLYHGLKVKEFECKHCQKRTSLELDGGQTLFLPFRPSSEPVQNRIRFESKVKC